MHAQTYDRDLVNFMCKPLVLLSPMCSQEEGCQDVHKKKGIVRAYSSRVLELLELLACPQCLGPSPLAL